MAQKKKLQVFVSSTYEDLKEERQAAVEAILTAGHIPAGMELFAAGDESQMAVIRRWIDESDVFLLILGGRYGSLEPESGKSYIHLEYEYALEQGKPLFAVVIKDEYLEEKVRVHGRSVIEAKEPRKLEEFREFVKTKLVEFWGDPRDITIAIYKTIADFLATREMTGWVPGSEVVDTGALAEEIARLGRENAALRSQLENMSNNAPTYNLLKFEEMYGLLLNVKFNDADLGETLKEQLLAIARAFGDEREGLIHLLWFWRDMLVFGQNITEDSLTYIYALKLEGFALVTRGPSRIGGSQYFRLNDTGKQFLLRLRTERDTDKVEQYSTPF